MKTQIKFLPILTVLALGAAALQPASAQGARFKFEPNKWKQADPIPQEQFTPAPLPHSVQSGSVPHGGSFLGLDDPRMKMSPPVVAPIARAAITPAMTSTRAVPMNNTITPFHASFGKPISPPAVAALPKTATPLAIPQTPAKPAVAKALASKPSTGASRSLHGTLLTPQPKRILRPSSANALAMHAPKVEGYGKNVGYTPGAFLPMASGSSSSVRTNVSGVLVNAKRK